MNTITFNLNTTFNKALDTVTAELNKQEIIENFEFYHNGKDIKGFHKKDENIDIYLKLCGMSSRNNKIKKIKFKKSKI